MVALQWQVSSISCAILQALALAALRPSLHTVLRIFISTDRENGIDIGLENTFPSVKHKVITRPNNSIALESSTNENWQKLQTKNHYINNSRYKVFSNMFAYFHYQTLKTTTTCIHNLLDMRNGPTMFFSIDTIIQFNNNTSIQFPERWHSGW